MKILQNSDKQLVVAMKDSITILSDDKTLVSVDKEIVCAAANTLGILDDLKEQIRYYNDELNKIYEADRNLNVQLKTYKAEIRNLKDNLDQVNDLCEERERIINECNQRIIDYEEIIKDLKKTNEYYTRKENCATPVKECDDHDSSYPPTKVK
jgi:chromosome segregation ATPase